MTETTGRILMRRAQPADAEVVRLLVRGAYARWVPIIGREPLPMTADYDTALRQHVIDLAYRDHALVGLIETIVQPDHLFIENVAVDVACQGRGIGRQLLHHAETAARTAGLSEIRLLTNEAFDSNVRLYRSEGYDIERREPFMGGVTVYFRKHLAL